MNLKLENIGIVQSADINIDGLTVIAGENDSGKSTVGKVLYALIKTIRLASNIHGMTNDSFQSEFNKYVKSLFKSQISIEGNILFKYDTYNFTLKIDYNNCSHFTYPREYRNTKQKLTSPLFIDSPYIWNIVPSLKAIRNFESHTSDIDFEVLQTLKDLHFALTTKLKDDGKIKIDIMSIIKGNFQENSLGDFVFKKDKENIELINTAMGIKYFGILQVLSDKNHFYDGQILILDEPEVHLHPKWQLKLAELIVTLVKNGVKILVNSHSPYMIEALQRYSEKAELESKSHFYLAQDGIIGKIEDSNSRTLSEIFEKLSEPYDVFEQMESDRF